MTPQEAFVRAICDNPDDDAPRLMYADWLTEHGNSRGEFIRLQCAIVQSPQPQGDLVRRAEELASANTDTWLAELPDVDGVLWKKPFVRGFIEEIEAKDAGSFVNHAEALFSAAPVRKVRVRNLHHTDDMETFVSSPWLSRVRELDLNGNPLGELGATLIASAGQLAPLGSLLIHNSSLGDTGTRSLVSGLLRGLRELFLSGNAITDAGVASLAASPGLANLVELDLRDNLLTDEGAGALAGSKHLRKLRTLWLVNNRIGDAGVAALAQSPNFAGLSHLYLNYNAIGDEGLLALARSPYLAGLTELDLRNNRITDVGALALAESPLALGLTKLWLGRNRIGREARAALEARLGRLVVD